MRNTMAVFYETEYADHKREPGKPVPFLRNKSGKWLSSLDVFLADCNINADSLILIRCRNIVFVFPLCYIGFSSLQFMGGYEL